MTFYRYKATNGDVERIFPDPETAWLYISLDREDSERWHVIVQRITNVEVLSYNHLKTRFEK